MTEDHDLCGWTRHDGDKGLMLFQSATRDELVSVDADRFRKPEADSSLLGP